MYNMEVFVSLLFKNYAITANRAIRIMLKANSIKKLYINYTKPIYPMQLTDNEIFLLYFEQF